MSAKSNLKIKKSKLSFRPLQEVSFHSLNPKKQKQKRFSEILCKSVRQSNFKFKTVNYKEYSIEKKNQLQKRKGNQKSLILYLDGANPLTTKESQNCQTSQIRSTIPNLQQKSPQILLKQPPKSNDDRKFLSSKKSFKSFILKQIQLKNRKKISRNQNTKINPTQFLDINEIFLLKKLNQPHCQAQKKSIIKIANPKSNFRQGSCKNKNQGNLITSQKFSVSSERTVKQKNKKQAFKNINHKHSQILFPSIDKKLSRPLVSLDIPEAKKIESQSFIVLKYPQKQIISGKLYKRNAQIASLTKIMTFYTILSICKEYQVDYSKRIVQIIEKAESMTGTSAQIFSGEKFTLQQLFYGMMLPSGNDAAVAIASQGGLILKQKNISTFMNQQNNVKCFINYMNILAKSIGMSTSFFTNPHGLSDHKNCSNPFELSLLISQCLKFQEFLRVTSTKKFSCWTESQGQRREVIWQNTHKLLRREGFIGGKTGVTVTAGPCLATIYKSTSGQIFIVVVLRSPKLSRRFKQTRWILGLSLKQYKKKYNQQVKLLMEQNPQLDSDNSEDQHRFDFNKNDSSEFNKRKKILTYEL